MIPRYEKTEISQFWTEEYKLQTLLQVELAILEAQEGSKVPQGTAEKIRCMVQIRPQRILEIESQVHHDIIAFCTSITEQLPAEVGKFFHFGVTSSDIIDSGLSLQIKRSLKVILKAFEDLLQTLWQKSQESKDLITLGRSHGMYAEPMSFGQKFLGFYAEFYRRYQDLKEFYENECTAQFSGAVGNYTILTPELEKRAASLLELKVEPVSTQVLPRDRIGKLLTLNGLLGSAIERIAVEIRHLHRSEVGEVHEGFAIGQKGSSTMPHKKNPIAGENLTGLSRVIRSHVQVGLENIVLWHERDISHSSAERLILPDNLGLVYYCINRLKNTLGQLQLHSEQIEKRVTETFSYLSSYYLHHLLENFSLTREEAYQIVQEASFASPAEKGADFFRQEIIKRVQEKVKDSKVSQMNWPKLDRQELKKIFMKHVDEIFERTLKLYPLPTTKA